jgi:cell division protease FtsH
MVAVNQVRAALKGSSPNQEFKISPGTAVRLADVLGCDEAKAELQQVLDFLQRPDAFHALGATIPKVHQHH